MWPSWSHGHLAIGVDAEPLPSESSAQELLEERAGGAGAGLTDVHERADGQVSLARDHPGVGEALAAAVELRRARLGDHGGSRYVAEPDAGAARDHAAQQLLERRVLPPRQRRGRG